MNTLGQLFQNNARWSRKVHEQDPDFFARLSQKQKPRYLWIGCSDSRVPANQIVGLESGELFVHRNIANMVVHTDLNCLSVLQYAVDVLKVEHIIICGHYGCGGVKTAMEDKDLGLIDSWLMHIRDVGSKYREQLHAIEDPQLRYDRLCELNVIDQVQNACRTASVRNAWQRGQSLAVHGWIYSLQDGLLRELNLCVTSSNELESVCDMALNQLGQANRATLS